MIVGIDIGGTHFRIAKIQDEIISDYQKIKTNQILKSEDSLNDLYSFLNDYIGSDKIDAISIGFPATLDVDRKKVIQLPNIKAMENLEVVDYLKEKLKVPVYIERDANMQVLADIKVNKLENAKSVVAIYFGTGIGSAIVINNQLYLGYSGVAGEIGHIVVDGDNTECGCGNLGCIEALAGGKYLQKINDEVFKDDISLIFKNHNDDKLIHQFIERMSQAIVAYINILNPEYLILGGAILNMQDFPIEELKKCIESHARKPEPLNSLKMIIVDDDLNKGVLGAYYLAKDKLASK